MKRYIMFAIHCLLFTALAAQGLSEQEIIQKMTAAAEQIKTVRCNFTQTKRMKMLAGEQVSKGKMYCQQPDKLRWEYTSPKASVLVLDGNKVQTLSNSSLKGEKKEASPLRGGMVGSMARMIMNSVAGKCLTDDKSFQVSAKELPSEYIATLLPLKKEMKRLFSKLVLHFDLRQSTVTQVELHEKNGDRTIIDLHDIQINK